MNSKHKFKTIAIQKSEFGALKARFWTPAEPSTKQKNLLIVHGACEHGGRYVKLGQMVADEGWRVLAPDLRGHGESDGNCVHVSRFEDYLLDINSWMEKVEFDPAHTVIIGCSMGGLISIRWNQWYQQQFDKPGCEALLLISPLLGIKHPIEAWKKIVAHLLSRFFPQTRFRSTIQPRLLTHDHDVLVDRAHDPLLRKQVTARWYLECDLHLRKAFEQVAQFSPPTWILQSGNDFIVDPLASRAWAEWINLHSPGLVQYFAFPGWYHEVFKETQGEHLQRKVIEFLAEFEHGANSTIEQKQTA